jgi:hypothetical protein
MTSLENSVKSEVGFAFKFNFGIICCVNNNKSAAASNITHFTRIALLIHPKVEFGKLHTKLKIIQIGSVLLGKHARRVEYDLLYNQV